MINHKLNLIDKLKAIKKNRRLMKPSFNVYFSNKVEYLLQSFKERIYHTPSALTRRLVIVSSPALKSWLMLQLAKDPFIGIAAGLEIYYLDEAMEKLRTEYSSSSETKRLPSLVELALALEVELRSMCSDAHHVWQPLQKYLQFHHGEPLSKKSERRLIALASKLAMLFKQYGKYGGKMVEEWEQTEAQEWQQKLWKHIFDESSPWTYLYRELESPLTSHPQDMHIHLFSISHIPPLFHRHLEKFSRCIPVTYYLLSPCQYFWSDIRSDKESHRLSAYWKAKGISLQQQETLEEFLRDRNPLLANFGRLGREMAQLLENTAIETREYYALPASAREYPQIEALTWDDNWYLPAAGPLTVLQAIQGDMLLLRNPGSNADKLHFEQFDGSIQIHCSGTKLREIQALYDLLAGIMSRHQADAEPICPEDIIVMAPDIKEYEPFIKSVFQGPESQIDIHLMDTLTPVQSQLVQGFIHLLEVASSRWDAATLLQLFEYAAFQKKHALNPEDIEQFRRWIRESGIRWGTNTQHRNELLERDHCLHGKIEQSSSYTWEDGFNKLLTGLIMPIPEIDISATQGELLGKWLKILHSLKVDLQPLSDHSMHTLKHWAAYLQTLHNSYFARDEEASHDGESALEDAFCSLKKASKYFPNAKFPFASIKRHLETLLNYPKTSYRESRLNAASFCSLLPLRTIPAKVIVLLGLQEGNYPRTDHLPALNLMIANPKADYFPSQTDFDRYLFLEALLSARQYFIMSYLGYSEVDFKEQIPALLVTEMLNYLDQSYIIQGEPPSKHCLFQHPFHAFDARYFEPGSQLKSYSQSQYRAALAYYHLAKKEPYHFLPACTILTPKNMSGEICINLSDLSAFAANPLKTYFNKRLGIYLSREEDRIINHEESLLPSYLEFDRLKKIGLKLPFEDVVSEAERMKLLPPRIFKDVTIETLREKIEELKSNLASVEVDPNELFAIEFSERYAAAQKSSTGSLWQCPPLKIKHASGASIKIVGKLNDAAPQGLLEYIENEKDVAKSWPRFLAFQCLVKEHALPVKPHLLFMKSGCSKASLSEDPHFEFSQYLEHYFCGLENPSMLLPEWVPTLVKENNEKVLESLEALESSRNFLYNEYLKWILHYSALPPGIVEWKGAAQKLFGSILSGWFKKK